MRRAARADANSAEIVKAARLLGWRLWNIQWPVDWLGMHRGILYAIEIKTKKGKLTADQKIAQQTLGASFLTWRSIDDMLADSR